MGSSPESVSESDGVFPTTFANTWETSYQPSPKSGGKVYLAGALTGARATGLRGFDMQKGYQQRLSSSIEDIDDASFRPTISTWGDSRLYLAGMSWLVLPRNNEYGLQSGRFDATDTNTTIKITFDPPYQKTPSVIAWIAGYHLGYQTIGVSRLRSRMSRRQIALWLLTGGLTRMYTPQVHAGSRTQPIILVSSVAHTLLTAFDRRANRPPRRME